MVAFKKVLRLGRIDLGLGRNGNLYCKVESDGEKLSFVGVIGPDRHGHARGGAGQIIIEFKEYDHRGHMTLDAIIPAPRWTPALIRQFFDAWDRWHVNNMKAGTPAQERYLRDNPIEAVYPESHYDKASAALAAAGLNPDNGYKYGSAWLSEDVPEDVLTFLCGLPDTDKTPAWV